MHFACHLNRLQIDEFVSSTTSINNFVLRRWNKKNQKNQVDSAHLNCLRRNFRWGLDKSTSVVQDGTSPRVWVWLVNKFPEMRGNIHVRVSWPCRHKKNETDHFYREITFDWVHASDKDGVILVSCASFMGRMYLSSIGRKTFLPVFFVLAVKRIRTFVDV